MNKPTIEVRVRDKGHVNIDPNDDLIIKNDMLQGIDFSGRKYQRVVVVNGRLEGCRFEKMRLDEFSYGAGREMSEYIDCSFDGMRVHNMGSGHARFVRCTFRNVELREWFGWSTELIDCTFSGRLRKAVFSGAVLEDDLTFIRRKKNEFSGNDFSAMRLEDVGFRNGIDLSQQRLPSGPEYLYLPDAEASVRHARSDVITWRDLDKRREAMILINILEEDIRNGQQQLFLSLNNYNKSTRDVDEAVFALLRGT